MKHSAQRNGVLSRNLAILMLAVLAPSLAAGSLSIPLRVARGWQESASRESGAWITALRQSQFAAVPHPSAYSSCEISEPPEALATPDPLVELSRPNSRISVSFIVGTDGRVHSPFILDSAGALEDRTVLDAVRSWRYRPAKCNGVPAEAEGRIEFLVR